MIGIRDVTSFEGVLHDRRKVVRMREEPQSGSRSSRTWRRRDVWGSAVRSPGHARDEIA